MPLFLRTYEIMLASFLSSADEWHGGECCECAYCKLHDCLYGFSACAFHGVVGVGLCWLGSVMLGWFAKVDVCVVSAHTGPSGFVRDFMVFPFSQCKVTTSGSGGRAIVCNSVRFRVQKNNPWFSCLTVPRVVPRRPFPAPLSATKFAIIPLISFQLWSGYMNSAPLTCAPSIGKSKGTTGCCMPFDT